MAGVLARADQAPESLRQACANDPVVIPFRTAILLGGSSAAGAVENGGARPGHTFHHDAAQRPAGHVDPVAQRIGAEQAGARIVAEDVGQRARIDRIDMLRIERQAGAREAVGDPATGEPIGETSANLKAAIAVETFEYTDMYPGMAKSAQDEGFEEIADWFQTLAKAERSHANRFQKALDTLDD